jgi:glycerophosphoryl diester phosphodiesterase
VPPRAAPRPRLLAHRGHRAAGPENSLRSVVAAFDACDGAEVDVLVTADGRPVLRHDERLADGTPIRSLSLAEARLALAADADDLPEAGAVLAAVGWRGTLNLELKVPGAARALRPLADRLANVTFTSLYAAEVLDALALFPSRPAGLLVSRWPSPFVPARAALLSVRHALLAEARAAFPAAPLWAWTVNDAEAMGRARVAACEVVISDDVVALQGALAL